MKTWFFTEDAYPYLPDPEHYDSIRVDLPSRFYDPEKGAELYSLYLDLWCYAEECGLDIMLNEHHQTATCVVPAAPVMLGALSRLTKKSRLLILGNPIVNRTQPVRVAEEMAMIDVMSNGRLECGFVRGVPYEASAANISAFRGSEKLWEAHDLILKAWTTHDGPFNFEGRWFHHRQVNVWPRPLQQPHPPVWITVGSGPSTVPVAGHKHVGAVFLAGYGGIRKIFDAYRAAYLAAHKMAAPLDRLAYCALIYVADTPALAREGAQKLMWYMHSNKVATQYQNPPGYHPPAISAQMLRGNASKRNEATLDDQIARGNVFAGTPDQVYQQIKSFWEYSGGFGHLLMMGQAGFLTPEETKRSMYLFGQEVFPRLKALNAGYEEGRMHELRAATPDVAIAPIAGLSVDFVR